MFAVWWLGVLAYLAPSIGYLALVVALTSPERKPHLRLICDHGERVA